MLGKKWAELISLLAEGWWRRQGLADGHGGVLSWLDQTNWSSRAAVLSAAGPASLSSTKVLRGWDHNINPSFQVFLLGRIDINIGY